MILSRAQMQMKPTCTKWIYSKMNAGL